jgi:glucosamine--fructose-6-phosphate aminotransferase (isomerizing)
MSGEILHKEIYEQPQVIADFLESESENVRSITQKLGKTFQYLLIAARGSSDNAARYAQYVFGSLNRLPVALATPSLFTLYDRPPKMQGACVVGISQSGQSPDILAVVEEGRRQGQPTLAITNDLDSPLAEAAEYVIPLHAGPEKAVAATKTYTASLAALALMSCHLDDDQERLGVLQGLPDLMRETLKDNQAVIETAERYRFMERCVVIGRGYNYATAFEVSLKITELTRIIAESYSSADFMHGPIAMVDQGFPILLIAPSGNVLEDLKSLVDRLESLQAEMLIISDDRSLLSRAQVALPLQARVPEWVSPLLAVLPGQLYSLGLAQARGMDPDRPHGLTKVTETW